MEVELAQELGFCSGVRRALRLLRKAAREYGNVVTLGDAVHNRQVVEELSSIGVRSIVSLSEVDGHVVAVPSHGLSKQNLDEIRALGLSIVDTTCPRVERAQRSAAGLVKAGFQVVVFGDIHHPEVESILSWTHGQGRALRFPEEMPSIEDSPMSLGILSQTTQNVDAFAAFASKLVSLHLGSIEELRVVNTICDATKKRQEAALELAKKVELMIVIGGYNSANTGRLAEVCASTGVETHHVEAAWELEPEQLKGKRIGVSAGASTPDHVIRDVVARLNNIES